MNQREIVVAPAGLGKPRSWYRVSSLIATLAGLLTTALVYLLRAPLFADLHNYPLTLFVFLWIFGVMLACAFSVVRHADVAACRLGELRPSCAAQCPGLRTLLKGGAGAKSVWASIGREGVWLHVRHPRAHHLGDHHRGLADGGDHLAWREQSNARPRRHVRHPDDSAEAPCATGSRNTISKERVLFWWSSPRSQCSR
jgi:hypothetical protein